MSETYRAVIPYESLDPLTIGASDDETKVHRDTIEIDLPQANVLAAIYPTSPTPSRTPPRRPGTRSSIPSRARLSRGCSRALRASRS